ncbi:BTAD domain-containing putative transcriptional regulator [Streptomyces sp. NPDC058877]|uniref:AfsR/SARP family transcriptional regulator n=1 Tax=unclassified Streptomyces TaxID=2593676 RepID=UPI0036B5C1D7
MKIQVLGPLNAEINDVSIVPTARKPRQILALLALYPGRVVPVTTLMEEIWGTQPPHSALTTLQSYILQVRRRLNTAIGPHNPHLAKEILATRHGGYLLQFPTESIDVHTYEQLARQGHQAFEEGDDEKAATLLQQALALWQGPALVDVHVGPILEIETMRLEESRLVTTERRIDADLRLGRHTEILAELTQLTARHPQHEGLHAQAMLALYRSGRRATALTLYHHLRTHLITELGVEPSPQIQRLHQAILTVNPTLNTLTTTHPTSTYDLFTAH